MKAVIMAGGKGTRLSSVLHDIPKPMVRIGGLPVLEHQINGLKDYGIHEITLIVGHLAQVIMDYFGDGSSLGVQIHYIQEQQPLGTAGGLFYLKDEIKENFLLLFGDIFMDIDFSRLYSYHVEKGGVATLLVHPNAHPYDSDLVLVDDNCRVIGWDSKHNKRDYDYKNIVNAGVYVFSPEIFSFIDKLEKIDLEHDILLKAMRQAEIYAYHSTEYVKDIGTPERLCKVEADYQSGITRKRNLAQRQKCIFLDRDGTINRLVGLLSKVEQMELEVGAGEAIARLNDSEYLVIVITNQPVIARGDCSIDDLDKIHNRLCMLLSEKGAFLDDIFFCPHHPDGGYPGEVPELKIRCSCRKPNTELLARAAATYNIDLAESWFVGDTTMDVQTGINAGTRTALLHTGEAGKDKKYNVIPDWECKSLQAFTYALFNGERD